MIEPSHIVVLGNLHMDRDMQEGRFGNERSRTACAPAGSGFESPKRSRTVCDV